jgi:hypothetical protein
MLYSWACDWWIFLCVVWAYRQVAADVGPADARLTRPPLATTPGTAGCNQAD